MDANSVISPDAKGQYHLDIARSDIVKVDIADVDVIVQTKSGEHYLLTGAGLAAMMQNPPTVNFKDGGITAEQLLGEVGAIKDVALSIPSPTTLEEKGKSDKDLQAALKQEHAKEKQLEHHVKEVEVKLKAAQQNEHQHDQQESSQAHAAALTMDTEQAVENLVAQAQKIIDDGHLHDYDFQPIHQFNPPPAAFASPPGVSPPLSLVPIVTLYMGNVVGNTTSVSGGITTILGGGGAVGSDAAAQIGPRDAQQFSTTVINGTSGNDLIYAEGNVANNGTARTTLYAKELSLNVAGYFTSLNDAVITGVPAGVTIVGATNNGGGTWTLPAATVQQQQTFTIVYDSALVTAGTSFDAKVTVSGETTRHDTFSATQNFRFEYMAVTSTGQVTDPSLIYNSADGILRSIYILPTLDQPNLITTGDGNDTVYGGQNNDTIIAGIGADSIVGGAGNDSITAGNGNNTIDGGTGNNIIATGTGNDSIIAADGNNTIDGGSGANYISVGNGANSITSGTGNDTIIAGNGANNIHDLGGANAITVGGGNNILLIGDGDSSITTGNGNNNITFGVGNDTVNSGTGNDTILAGNGNITITDAGGSNTINTGTGADHIVISGSGANYVNAGDGANYVSVGDGNNTLIGGIGNDSLYGGNGNNLFEPGIGTDIVTGGTGNNTVNYSTTGIALTITLGTSPGTATGAGLSDTLTNISNVVGNDAGDTITGSTAANSLTGGGGADSITGGGGADFLYGGGGNDTLTGGTGVDHIYGGSGNNTINGGTAGADFLYGGSGNNTFTAPHAGVHYDGTNGANIVTGQLNAIDYSADTTGMIINLALGTGQNGLADGATYAFTPTNGYNSINMITGGTGSDSITGSNSDDYLVGGAGGGTDSLYGGLGNNTLVGGTGNGNKFYYMGLGHDTIIASAAAYDRIQYEGSPSGLVINLDSVAHTFTNSANVVETVAAYSGSNFGVTTADANSYSTGDYYTPVSGTNTLIDRIEGSSFADLIFTGSDSMAYYNTYGGNDTLYGGTGNVTYLGYEQADFFYGGSGNDMYYYSNGNDRANGGTGFNIIRTNSYYAGDYNVVVYLDGTMDTNANGKADYIDRGVTSFPGSGYNGFEYGWNNATTGATATLMSNFENVVGNSANDYIVGDNNDNQINARTGANAIYGMGGNDIITAAEGTNFIDGGTGINTVNFEYNTSAVGGQLGVQGNNITNGVEVFLGDANFSGTGSDQNNYWGGLTTYQARTGSTGQYLYSNLVNIQNINGSDFVDVLYGDGNANAIYGNAGADTIAGNGGADSIYGGNDNDLLLSTSANMAAAVVFDGGAGTDTLQAAGWTFAANSFTSAKYNAIEVIDVRNQTAGGTYGLSPTDIQNISTHTTAAALTLKLDTGDTFTPTASGGGQVVLNSSDTLGTGDNHYKFFSNTGHVFTDNSNVIAQLTVHYGAG